MKIKLFLLPLFILNTQFCFCSDTKKTTASSPKQLVRKPYINSVPSITITPPAANSIIINPSTNNSTNSKTLDNSSKNKIEPKSENILNFNKLISDLIDQINKYEANIDNSNLENMIIQGSFQLINYDINIFNNHILEKLLINQKTYLLLEKLFKIINNISKEIIVNFLEKLNSKKLNDFKSMGHLINLSLLQDSEATIKTVEMICKMRNLDLGWGQSEASIHVLNLLKEISQMQYFRFAPQTIININKQDQTKVFSALPYCNKDLQ